MHSLGASAAVRCVAALPRPTTRICCTRRESSSSVVMRGIGRLQQQQFDSMVPWSMDEGTSKIHILETLYPLGIAT